jgi:HemX protein
MLDTIHILNIILPILYIATFIVYAYDFSQQKKQLYNSKRVFLFITLSLHIFYLLARTIEFNHPPITNKMEIFTILAFSTGFAYFLLELLTDIRGTGVFIIFFSVIFQIISSIFIVDLFEVKEVLRNRLLGSHVISALLGFAGITISAVYGLLFLILYKDIKLNRFGLIFKRLPSLETLERLSFVSMIIGFILLTISIIIGTAWLPSAFPDFSYSDPKLISSGLVWIVYGAGISAKLLAKWYGKKVIIFSLIGFSLALLSMFLSNVLAESFHSFY